MKKLFIVLICLVLTPSLRSQNATGSPTGVKPAMEQLKQQMRFVKSAYVNKTIIAISDDYKIFEYLLNDLETARALVPELIDLTEVRVPRPDTTEEFSPFMLSPAGSVLLKLVTVYGEVSLVEIKTRLAKADIQNGQREVLQEVVRISELIRRQIDLDTK